MLIAHNDLTLAISITSVSVKDWQKQPLAWAKVEGGYLWSTDGHRVIRCPIECDPSLRLFIHHKELKAMSKRRPEKVRGCKFYTPSATDFTEPPQGYPDCSIFFKDQDGFAPAGDPEFRDSFFGFLQGPSLKVVEFASFNHGFYGAFHQDQQSTYPESLSILEGIKLERPIAFRVEYLEDLGGFAFDSAKFIEGDKLGKLILRHADGHAAVIMATEITGEHRHRRFEWPIH
jgi:hypothetical protein